VYDRRLALSIIRKIKANAELSLARAYERQKRRQEYDVVVQMLGQPRRPRVSSMTRRPESVVSEEGYIETIRNARADSESLWRPFDLSALLLNPISKAFTDAYHRVGSSLGFTHRITLSLWSSDWSGTSGSWFRAKFGLEWDGSEGATYENKIHNASTTICLSALQQDVASYANIGLMVVEVGVSMSPEFDRAVLKEIVQRVVPQSRYRISILLVNFGAPDRVPDMASYAGLFYHTAVLTVPETGAGTALQESVSDLVASYEIRLSAFGEQQAQQNLAEKAKLAADRAAAKAEAEREQEYQDRMRRWNRLQAQTSLQYFRNLNNQQEIFAKSNKRKFSDTSVSSEKLFPVTKSSRSSAQIVPKSVSELRSLVDSVTRGSI
jgi:hypothetical protein